MSDYTPERREVLEAVRRIVAMGLVAGASGNVSRRIPRDGGDLIAITASRVPYHRFSEEHVVVCDMDLEPVCGDAVPSSESLAHVAVYRARPDVGAVIHTHSIYASAFAVAGEPLPAIVDEQVVLLGGAVEVAGYAPSASEELADNAVSALGDRAAVLLCHHGVLAAGADLDEAVAVAELVERIAQIRAVTLSINAGRELSDDVVRSEQQVYRMMKGFKT